MSQFTRVNIEVDNIDETIVEEIMVDLGWDGEVIDIMDGTVYYDGSGSICIGTSEMKQEELIRNSFNEKIGKEVDISIFWS